MSHYVVIKLLPNIITIFRLILAVPICVMILNEDYSAVLWIAFIAGVSDGIDGWLARKMEAKSRFGALVDPLADKVMLNSAFISFAVIGLLPWWMVAIVVMKDAIVVTGAVAYHWLFSCYEIAPSIWGKASTGVQIVFVLMLLTHQVYPVFPAFILQSGLWIVIVLALVSAAHYIYVWGGKALAASKTKN